MSQDLDQLVHRILDEIALSGNDGVSVSQLLALIDASCDDANKQTNREQQLRANRTDEVRPTKDHSFRAKVWKYLTARPEVIVGENRVGNHFSLGEIEALPGAAVARAGGTQGLPSSLTENSSQSDRSGTTISREDSEDALSPSAQLLEQLQPLVLETGEKNTDSTNSNRDDIEGVTGSQCTTPVDKAASGRPSVKRSTILISEIAGDSDSVEEDDVVDMIEVHDGLTPEAVEPSDHEPDSQETILAPSAPLTRQPRIYVTQEYIWKTITGHGVNSRKIPKFEWQCLYAIAVARGNGISQTDLLKATGQVNTSLPRRTDNLEKKGYIEKREILLRHGQKTSLLTVTRFTDKSNNAGLAALPDPTDLPASVLTEDLEPIFGHERWTGAFIDTKAFAQAIISIVRAWDVIQYSHLRMKMHVDELPWQRNVLKNTVRELRQLGVLQKVDATSPDDHQEVSKIGIKFLREPTSADWPTFKRDTRQTNSMQNPNHDNHEMRELISGADDDGSSDSDETANGSGETGLLVALDCAADSRLESTPARDQAGLGMLKPPQYAAETDTSVENSGKPFNKLGSHQIQHLPLANPPRRRGRPPKARPTIPASTFPSLIPQQTPAQASAIPQEVRDSKPAPQPRNFRGKGKGSQATNFTSYDEYQRDAGIPGVYFDIPELHNRRVGSTGRPKKNKIALFKSEKLKSLSWMQRETQERRSASTGIEMVNTFASSSFIDATNKFNQSGEEAVSKNGLEEDPATVNYEPEQRITLLEVAHDFGRKPLATCQSLHQPFSTSSYVSPYRTNASSVTPPISRHISQRLSTSPVLQSQCQSRFAASTTLPQIVRYSSPNALSESSRRKPSGGLKIASGSVVQPPVVEDSRNLPDTQLEAAIQAVEDIDIPDVAFRLPASMDGIPGNLCLATDKKSLTFLVEQPQWSAACIQISEISEPPCTSALGSKPMELRITTTNENNDEVVHRFRYLPTEAAFHAANNMRAKIVTAMTLLDLETNDYLVETKNSRQESEKPFKCDACGGSWKNWEGLKYHQTRSKTSCNPNYRPLVPVTNQQEKWSEGVRIGTVGRGLIADGLVTDGITRALERESARESDHGIPEGLPNRSVELEPSGGKSLSVDPPLEILSPSSFDQQSAQMPKLAVPTNIPKAAGPGTDTQQRKDLILALLDTNKGVFPGEKSLWFAYVREWLQKFPNSGLPSYKVCNAALGLLTATGHVRKVQFSFKGKQGRITIGTVITKNGIDPTSAEVTDVKENIKAAFPAHYIPPEFAPPKVVQSMLEEREARPELEEAIQAPYTSGPLDTASPWQGNKSVSTPLHPELPVSTTRSGRTSRRPQRLQVSENNHESQQNLDPFFMHTIERIDSEDDGSYSEHSPRNGPKSRKACTVLEKYTKERRKRKSSKRVNEQFQALKVARRDESTPGLSLMPQLRTPEDEPEQGTDSDIAQESGPRNQGPRNQGRKQAVAPAQPDVWNPTPTYLQDKNGAWSNSTPSQAGQKRSKKSCRLPEPVTYMQTWNNPAWNFRPYGHGVRPIFARPTKRTRVNPTGNTYLERIQRGFRPVIMPKEKKMYGPAVPSKNMTPPLLRTQNVGIFQLPDGTRSKRRRNSSIVLDETYEPSLKRRARPPSTLLPNLRRDSGQGSIISDADSLSPDVGQGKTQGYAMPEMEVPIPDFRPRHMAPPSFKRQESAAAPPRNPGLDSLPYSVKTQTVRHPLSSTTRDPAHCTVQFLPPNTGLEDGPDDLELVSPPAVARLSSTPATSELEADQLIETTFSVTDNGIDEPYVIQWVEPRILRGNNRRWTTMIRDEFEEGSFTVEGWFPSAAFILKQLLPRTLNDILAYKQSRAVVAERLPSPQWGAFLAAAEEVARWEQGKGKGLLQIGTVAPDYIFINHSIATLQRPYDPEPVALQWLDDNNFTLETLPYDELDTDREYKKPTKIKGSPKKRRRRGTQVCTPIASATHRTQNEFMTRRLTALPADVKGVVASMANDPDFVVEVAFNHSQNQPRKRKKEGDISPETDNRLLVAVVVVRTLTGGLDRQIDWVLVSKLFPAYPMNFVQKRWHMLVQKHRLNIDRLGADFQEFFIKAYESGAVPPIDYNRLLGYDWDGLINLVIQSIDTSFHNPTPELPGSRSQFDRLFNLKKVGDRRPWRDDFFGQLPPVYKRMEWAASEQCATPLPKKPAQDFPIDHLTLAKSWVRAGILTPAEVYDQTFAARKLATLGNALAKSATSALVGSKVLILRNKGRPSPGRGVEITDTFASSFRKHLDETHLSQAVAFKSYLDTKFWAGEIATVEWTANEGEILAMTNLQAHNRIKLIPTNVPMKKFGLTDGDYQTKRMDKQRLRFDVQIVPTASYIYDPDLPILDKLTANAEPPRSDIHAIPIWYDIAENLIPEWWKKVLCTVLGTMAMRPGMTVKEIVRVFSPGLEEWETRLFLDWGVRVGALTVLREGYEGWNVGEWWWAIGGRAWE